MAGEWFETFFDEVYPELWGEADHFPPEKTAKEARFAMEALGLKPPARVLDLACGHGRHCLELARAGFRVTGVDLTQRFLDRGKRAADEEGLSVTWMRQDMRRIEFADEFDGVISMFTAFGYFEDEEEDLEVLRRVARALKPGGRFLVDVMNRDWIMANFRPCDVLFDREGVYVADRRQFDPLTGINHSTISVFKEGQRKDYEMHCRLFNLTEMAWFLKRAGMSVLRAYGSYEGEDFEGTSWRMLAVAEKPAAGRASSVGTPRGT